jgi:hypothetical protein
MTCNNYFVLNAIIGDAELLGRDEAFIHRIAIGNCRADAMINDGSAMPENEGNVGKRISESC